MPVRVLTSLNSRRIAPGAMLLAAALAAMPVAGCGGGRQRPAESVFSSMGTIARVTAPASDAARLPEYEAAARRITSDLEDRLSVYKPDSEIVAVGKEAGVKAVAVSAPTYDMLREAKRFFDLTRGVFDPTVAPIMTLWKMSRERYGSEGIPSEAEPSDEVIRETLQLVGCGGMLLTNGTVFLEKKGMRLDLGGIAKGYAVDACFQRLHARGTKDFLIDLGGNIRCLGGPRRGESWRVGVRDPFDSTRRGLLGTLRLTGGIAAATSGNYERFVTIRGKKYCHIVDPRSGRPVEGMAGVTVVCPSAAQADALSTALFVLGIEEGGRLLRKMAECEALFVPDRQPVEIWVTPGFMASFEPDFEVRDNIHAIVGPPPAAPEEE